LVDRFWPVYYFGSETKRMSDIETQEFFATKADIYHFILICI